MTVMKNELISRQRRKALGMMGLSGAVSIAGLSKSVASVSVPDSRVRDGQQQVKAQSSGCVPYMGLHQAGIVTPRPSNGMVVSFTVVAPNKQELGRLFRILTNRIAFLTTGGVLPEWDPKLPPPDSGILGPAVSPDHLTITVSVGASLFDERFGLSAKKPLHLQRMWAFPNDALNAELCHGDISIQFCANNQDTNIHALRDIIKHTPDLMVLLWKQEGNVAPTTYNAAHRPENARNFLGFRDGSANPDAADEELMNKLVWVQAGSDEPAWATHGSYQVIRIIRNFVERWDRTPLQEQEHIIGRKKANGAPLDGGESEHDVPDYQRDQKGFRTPLDAHIRLANPRTAATQENLILRRPFNYSNGTSKAGQLEMGLLFICYQANLAKGFIEVQNRLNGEPLEEYIKPIGGGYFFTLPGVVDKSDWFGRTLLEG